MQGGLILNDTNMYPRVAHFEIHADNPERAVGFYKKVFGWDINRWDSGDMEYWMIETAPKGDTGMGINGGLLRRNATAPEQGMSPLSYVCTIVVDSFDAYASKIEANGGKVAMPKSAIMGMAWQGYFFDTEGNIFGLHQPDESAGK